MKPKLILCFALVLSGGLFGCSKTSQPGPSQNVEALGKLYEIHSFSGRPSVAIYLRGFPDASFSAYLADEAPPKLLFLNLPEMLSQFGYATNSIIRNNRAKRVCADRNGVGMYDVFWSQNLPRFAIALKGNFIAAYDCKTGQKIQIKEGIDTKYQCQALGVAIQQFLDGKDFTEAELSEIRKSSYSGQTNP